MRCSRLRLSGEISRQPAIAIGETHTAPATARPWVRDPPAMCRRRLSMGGKAHKATMQKPKLIRLLFWRSLASTAKR